MPRWCRIGGATDAPPALQQLTGALIEPRSPIEHAVPVLPGRDLHATLAFYERLGFGLQGAPIEQYGYLIIARGSIELHFFDAPDVDPLTTATGCYVRVTDADALYREWHAVGIEADPATGSRLIGPTTTDYGMREFALVDPSGNLLRVGSAASERPA